MHHYAYYSETVRGSSFGSCYKLIFKSEQSNRYYLDNAVIVNVLWSSLSFNLEFSLHHLLWRCFLENRKNVWELRFIHLDESIGIQLWTLNYNQLPKSLIQSSAWGEGISVHSFILWYIYLPTLSRLYCMQFDLYRFVQWIWNETLSSFEINIFPSIRLSLL